jgi:hypothetical protein
MGRAIKFYVCKSTIYLIINGDFMQLCSRILI